MAKGPDLFSKVPACLEKVTKAAGDLVNEGMVQLSFLAVDAGAPEDFLESGYLNGLQIP